MRMSRQYARLIMLSLLMFVSSSISVLAQDSDTPESSSETMISIIPKGMPDGSRFEIELGPGESAEMVAVIQNFGAEPIELRTFITGIVPMANGGLQIAERDAELHGSTLWLDYPGGEFTLAPGESTERVISVTVPEDAAPGQYVNAVSLETVNPVNEDASGAFTQYFRKVVSVYVVVPGALAGNFEISEPIVEVFQGRAVIHLPVTNIGNARVDLTGSVTLVDSEGEVVSTGDLVLGPIYMGQETEILVSIRPAPPVGDYMLTYVFTDSASGIVVTNENLALEMPEDEQPGDAVASFDNVEIAANADPIVFANVVVDVNATTPQRSTRLTMSVTHDGELVEEFVLADNLALPQGSTTVTQRYLPALSWQPGTYEFSLKLELIEGGSLTLLLEEENVVTLEVP